MDQSFLLDANSVVNAIMQQQSHYGAGPLTVGGNSLPATNGGVLPGGVIPPSGFYGIPGAAIGYYSGLSGDPSALGGMSNSYYQSIVGQPQQMQFNQMLMQL